MQTKYELRLPLTVYSGENGLDRIPEILAAKGVKRLAIFTDKGVEKAGVLDLPLEKGKSAGVETVILDDLPAEPTYLEVQKTVDRCRGENVDFIMAVGGGSVMDTAKLTSVLTDGDRTVKKLLEDPGQAKKGVGTLMIPTTAGTGAEATPNAIVAVPEKEVKVGIVSGEMIPDAVILDAAMIKTLPRKIAAATGVDALAHAIECYTSNKANPFSDMFALQALEMILNHIERACDDGEAMEDKGAMLLASFYAGVAITASGTTAVHALSYPLGGKYHIAHGVSNAILLTPVMRFNEPVCRPLLAKAYDRCIGRKAGNEAEKSAALITRLEEIVRHLDIPTSLSFFGVPEGDLETLVASGMAVTRLLTNNRRRITAEDARRIYREVL